MMPSQLTMGNGYHSSSTDDGQTASNNRCQRGIDELHAGVKTAGVSEVPAQMTDGMTRVREQAHQVKKLLSMQEAEGLQDSLNDDVQQLSVGCGFSTKSPAPACAKDKKLGPISQPLSKPDITAMIHHQDHCSVEMGQQQQATASVFPPWLDLPPGVLGLVAIALPATASQLLPLCLVCKTWREVLIQDHVILKLAWFNLDPFHPLKHQRSLGMCTRPWGTIHTPRLASSSSSNSRNPHHTATRQVVNLDDEKQQQQQPCERFLLGLDPSCYPADGPVHASGTAPAAAAAQLHGYTRGRHSADLRRALEHQPALLAAAARVRNLSAMGVLAQLYEVAGLQQEAMRWWRRCAAGGDLEGMFKVGLAMYQGSAGVDADANGTYTWLSKALKKLLAVSSLSQIRVDAPKPRQQQQQLTGQDSLDQAMGGLLPAATAPAFSPGCVSPGQAAIMMPMVARAAVVLGYLHFDGEGTRADAGEACRLFKLAAACGSREGERVLGWMWNTGQY